MSADDPCQDWVNAFARAAESVGGVSDVVMEGIAKEIEYEAKERVPIGPDISSNVVISHVGGTLHASIITTKDREGVYTVGAYADYALFVEERSEVHHPNGQAHFMRDAVGAVLPKVTEEMEKGLERMLKETKLR
jgi:hypothetical protein